MQGLGRRAYIGDDFCAQWETIMNDHSYAPSRDTLHLWISGHRESYLRSGGVEGHIDDITGVGGRRLGLHCLIKYVGRRSGKVFITPLCYGAIGGEIAVVASKGGAPDHPAWCYDVQVMGTVDVQVGTHAFRGTWREPSGEERRKVWEFTVDG